MTSRQGEELKSESVVPARAQLDLRRPAAYRQPPLFTYDFIAPYLKSDRQGFNVSEFALNVGLDGPVGGTYFTVEA